MEVGQKITGSVQFLDRKGRPAKVDGKPAWSVSDEAIVSLVISEDGLSAEFEALAEGSVVVQVQADADLGEGVKPIIGTGALAVLPAEAVGVEISFGEPQDPA